ncbi:MAG: SDR family NAD(P)-dependent oxidoreductase [Spirochaetales bacterium]|jgi:dehydrogenase/reductase SDR family protein 7B|nr:SDR family NAD(P)-dependent oxidoreductase [Spirochaetales bacterium]
MVEFKNKIVWITGASSGIGESLAEVFARQGARVIISSHEAEELARVKEKLKPISEDIHTLVFNLANAKEVEAAAAKVLKEFGGVDVLMNNGGISQRALAAESPLEVDRLVMEVDYFAGVILAKAVLPGMIERGEGYFGVTSTITGKFGFPMRSAYSAAKHALFGFYESLLAENHKHGIRVTMYSPGRVRTNISMNSVDKEGNARKVMDPGQANGITPEKCAQKMVRTMRNGRRDVLIGGSELTMVYIYKYARRLYYRMARTMDPL